MHWAHIVSYGAHKCSVTCLKSSFTGCADEKGEHSLNPNNQLHRTCMDPLWLPTDPWEKKNQKIKHIPDWSISTPEANEGVPFEGYGSSVHNNVTSWTTFPNSKSSPSSSSSSIHVHIPHSTFPYDWPRYSRNNYSDTPKAKVTLSVTEGVS